MKIPGSALHVTGFAPGKRITSNRTMKKELPDLHKQAFTFKNRKKLQHDGGRAWIKDSQLHEARSGVNGHLETKRPAAK
ncbi:MAG: hypothetical protein EBR93_03310 [Bacteroidetes bacterium]|nr:hypothetical protein [Bacteroidota bacterium]